jgi:hypothetical protein
MNKPLKRDFGFSRSTGWQDDRDEDLYNAAIAEWENRPKSIGRKRTREIDPSWLPFLARFQPIQGKSQGAFCDWADLNRSTFSAMQNKAIPMHIVELIGMWEAQGTR